MQQRENIKRAQCCDFHPQPIVIIAARIPAMSRERNDIKRIDEGEPLSSVKKFLFGFSVFILPQSNWSSLKKSKQRVGNVSNSYCLFQYLT